MSRTTQVIHTAVETRYILKLKQRISSGFETVRADSSGLEAWFQTHALFKSALNKAMIKRKLEHAGRRAQDVITGKGFFGFDDEVKMRAHLTRIKRRISERNELENAFGAAYGRSLVRDEPSFQEIITNMLTSASIRTVDIALGMSEYRTVPLEQIDTGTVLFSRVYGIRPAFVDGADRAEVDRMDVTLMFGVSDGVGAAPQNRREVSLSRRDVAPLPLDTSEYLISVQERDLFYDTVVFDFPDVMVEGHMSSHVMKSQKPEKIALARVFLKILHKRRFTFDVEDENYEDSTGMRILLRVDESASHGVEKVILGTAKISGWVEDVFMSVVVPVSLTFSVEEVVLISMAADVITIINDLVPRVAINSFSAVGVGERVEVETRFATNTNVELFHGHVDVERRLSDEHVDEFTLVYDDVLLEVVRKCANNVVVSNSNRGSQSEILLKYQLATRNRWLGVRLSAPDDVFLINGINIDVTNGTELVTSVQDMEGNKILNPFLRNNTLILRHSGIEYRPVCEFTPEPGLSRLHSKTVANQLEWQGQVHEAFYTYMAKTLLEMLPDDLPNDNFSVTMSQMRGALFQVMYLTRANSVPGMFSRFGELRDGDVERVRRLKMLCQRFMLRELRHGVIYDELNVVHSATQTVHSHVHVPDSVAHTGYDPKFYSAQITRMGLALMYFVEPKDGAIFEPSLTARIRIAQQVPLSMTPNGLLVHRVTPDMLKLISHYIGRSGSSELRRFSQAPTADDERAIIGVVRSPMVTVRSDSATAINFRLSDVHNGTLTYSIDNIVFDMVKIVRGDTAITVSSGRTGVIYTPIFAVLVFVGANATEVYVVTAPRMSRILPSARNESTYTLRREPHLHGHTLTGNMASLQDYVTEM